MWEGLDDNFELEPREGRQVDTDEAKKIIQRMYEKRKSEAEKAPLRDEVQEAIELFNSYRLNDLIAFEPDPKHFIAGRGWIKRGAGTLLTGGTGLGKSVLAEQIAVNLADGSPILGKIAVPKPVRVLYVECENDEEVLKADICSIVAAIGADHRRVQENLIIYHAYGLSGKKFSVWLDTICEVYKPDVIFIDPYQSYIGANNMNDSSSFLKWIEPVDEIIKRRMVGLVLVAHTPKPMERDDWNPLQGVYMAAGTSTLANWARRSCELTTIGKETKRFKLTFSKNSKSTGMYDEKFGGIIRELIVAHSPNVDKPHWLVDADQTIKGSTKNAREDIVALYVSDPTLSQGQIAAKLGISKSTVNKYWNDAKEEDAKKKKVSVQHG